MMHRYANTDGFARNTGHSSMKAGVFGTSQQDPFLARLERTEQYEALAAKPATISKAESLRRAAVSDPITLDNWQARSKAMGMLHVQNEAYEIARKERLQQQASAKDNLDSQQIAALAERNLQGQGQGCGYY